jgi:hypothetical protein
MGRNSARDYFWWTLYKRLVWAKAMRALYQYQPRMKEKRKPPIPGSGWYLCSRIVSRPTLITKSLRDQLLCKIDHFNTNFLFWIDLWSGNNGLELRKWLILVSLWFYFLVF